MSSSFDEDTRKNNGFGKLTCEYEGKVVYCFCGAKAPLITSTSDENPGKRFYGCGNYKVKSCKFFLCHDKPIADERAKVIIMELKNANKELVNENLLLKNENRALSTTVAEIKLENECMICYSSAEIIDVLCNEVVALKFEIGVVQSKLETLIMVSRSEAKAKKIYKLICFIGGLIFLYFVLNPTSDDTTREKMLALP